MRSAGGPLPSSLRVRRGCQRGKIPVSLSHGSVEYQQRGPRQWAGSCCHKRRAVARLRSPGAQATLRRLSRSTASRGHLAGKILDARFVRGGPGGIVAVLGHFAELHVAALYQAHDKLAHKLLAG